MRTIIQDIYIHILNCGDIVIQQKYIHQNQQALLCFSVAVTRLVHPSINVLLCLVGYIQQAFKNHRSRLMLEKSWKRLHVTATVNGYSSLCSWKSFMSRTSPLYCLWRCLIKKHFKSLENYKNNVLNTQQIQEPYKSSKINSLSTMKSKTILY